MPHSGRIGLTQPSRMPAVTSGYGAGEWDCPAWFGLCSNNPGSYQDTIQLLGSSSSSSVFHTGDNNNDETTVRKTTRRKRTQLTATTWYSLPVSEGRNNKSRNNTTTKDSPAQPSASSMVMRSVRDFSHIIATRQTAIMALCRN